MFLGECRSSAIVFQLVPHFIIQGLRWKVILFDLFAGYSNALECKIKYDVLPLIFFFLFPIVSQPDVFQSPYPLEPVLDIVKHLLA